MSNFEYNARPMRRMGNIFVNAFLTLVTLGFYLPVYYGKYVKKINILSRDAFGAHHNDVWFSSKVYTVLLAGFYLSCIAVIVLYDIVKIGLYAVVPMLVTAVLLVLFVLCCVYPIANRLKLIAKQYGRMDVFLLIDGSSFFGLEYACFKGFNELADEYNMRHNAGVYIP